MAGSTCALELQASAYQPPSKGALPHRQAAPVLSEIISRRTAGHEFGQGAIAAAESAMACLALGPAGSAFIPDQFGLTSREIVEQRALKQCSFAPRLNANNKSKSIVTQTWQEAQLTHQCPALHRLHTAAADVASDESSEIAAEPKSLPLVNTSAAVSDPGRNEDSDPPGAQGGTQVVDQQAVGVMKSSCRSSGRGRRQKQLGNSYAAAAQRSRAHQCALCTAPLILQQHQHDAMGASSSANSEAQLQADVADCDKRLEECMQARRQAHAHQKAQLGSSAATMVKNIAGHEQHSHADCSSKNDMESQQSALRVALEAELKDGSTARFQVQQVQSAVTYSSLLLGCSLRSLPLVHAC